MLVAKVGATLKNGTTLIAITETAQGESVVLAGVEGRSAHKYATWVMNDETGSTFWGHYHNSIVDAVADYVQRGGK